MLKQSQKNYEGKLRLYSDDPHTNKIISLILSKIYNRILLYSNIKDERAVHTSGFVGGRQ